MFDHVLLNACRRDRIFETLRTQGPRGRDKVNIFLNALGLDASQLAPPS